MAKRDRAEFTMRLDVEVDYDDIDATAAAAGKSAEALRRDALKTFSGRVIHAAEDAMRAAGQKYRHGGQEFSGEWVLYQIVCEGDPDGARAACEGWVERVNGLDRTRRILKATVRGPDGTTFEHPLGREEL